MIPFPHQKNVPLSSVCSFRIGGPASYFAKACNEEEMRAMLLFCHQTKLPFFILGKGSNSLFDDRGFKGLVILNGIECFEEKEGVFKAGGGFSFPRLGKIASRLGFTGLEFAAGIPGTVGGAVYMNAGASGQETKDSLQKVEFIREDGEKISYSIEELAFSYRYSSFQDKKGAITKAVFTLEKGSNPVDAQQKLLAHRLKTQPYKDLSAGCVFRNPDSGIGAGALIEACGLKGAQVGGAEVSAIHANFIVNKGGAKASDVLSLIEKVRACVYEKKGILLAEEVRKVPYEYV